MMFCKGPKTRVANTEQTPIFDLGSRLLQHIVADPEIEIIKPSPDVDKPEVPH